VPAVVLATGLAVVVATGDGVRAVDAPPLYWGAFTLLGAAAVVGAQRWWERRRAAQDATDQP
jgi:hypothetical protein